MKYTRWLQWRIRLSCVPAAMLVGVLSAHAQDRRIPPVGGPGGGEFIARCPAGQLLGGVEMRVGDDIDAIRPLCRIVSADLEWVRVFVDPQYSYEMRSEERVTYLLGDATATTGWYGGSGGHIETLLCEHTDFLRKGETQQEYRDRLRGSGRTPGQKDPEVVSGIFVEAEGENTVTVNRITLRCGGLSGPGSVGFFGERDFWSDRFLYEDYTFKAPQSDYYAGSGTSLCPADPGRLGMVAVGIHGRAGKWLDALGLICDEVKLPPPPVKAQGRVRLGAAAGATTGPPRAICDLARQARARNSPAAPGLEEKCRAAGAAGEVAPVKAQGRVNLDAATDASTGSPRAICDLARQARARNSPAAPGLEEKCRAAGAAREVAPVKAQGRVKLGAPTDAATAPPRVCDLARQARARNSPAALGLEEKCRADLAALGALIAEVDAIVAEARAAEMDALARQGFDIATAIFGDPALGGFGNTGTGPVSLGMRDQLTPAGKRGFDASVKLHLSRDYRPTPVDAAPIITANPNPVPVPNGQDAGTTTITWTAAPAYTYSEIYLSVDNGEWTEFARGVDGSKPTTIKLGTSQTFRMMVYEVQAGTPKIIATLTVTAQ